MRWLMFVPIILGIGVCKSWLFLPVAIVSIFVCIGMNKRCKSLEEIWVFVLSFFTLLPVTVRLLLNFFIADFSYLIAAAGILGGIEYFLQLICYFMMAMCVQMIVLLVLGRMIWSEKQKKGRV